jgi:hypothetical protein
MLFYFHLFVDKKEPRIVDRELSKLEKREKVLKGLFDFYCR